MTAIVPLAPAVVETVSPPAAAAVDGQTLMAALENAELSSLDRLVLRNVAGKMGLPPFYPGQPDPETLEIAGAAADAVGGDGYAASAAVALSHVMSLYSLSMDASHKGLKAGEVETKAILDLFDRHKLVAQPLFLATRYLLAKQYEGMDLGDAMIELGNGSGDTAHSILGDRKLCLGSTPIIDENMGARANFGSHRHYMAIDASQIPFQDETFATATMNYTFYHLEFPARTCGEVFRVLQPGGTFAFNFLKRDDVAATRVLPQMLSGLGMSDHARRADSFVFVDYGADSETPDLAQAIRLIEEAGFVDVKVRPYLSRSLSALIWWVRDFEIVLGLSAITGVANPSIAERYRTFCKDVLAPLLANDDDLAAREGGTFAFVTARKPGAPVAALDDEAVLQRRRCPKTGRPLIDRGGWLDGGGTAYPVLRGIPLMMPVYADIWSAQFPGLPPEERPEFRYLE